MKRYLGLGSSGVRIRALKPTGALILFLLLTCFLTTCISTNAAADIAPSKICFGSSVVFVEQENISMEAFYVNVSINLPAVDETYTYYMRNNGNVSINQTVTVPVFTTGHGYSYRIEEDKLFLNGQSIECTESEALIDKDELDIDMNYDDPNNPALDGYTAHITFPPQTTVEIKMVLVGKGETYTKEVIYIYSPKTGGYWDGNIGYGYFSLEYQSKYKTMDYEGPSGSLQEGRVVSEMWDWNPDDDYKVTVDTGVRYGGGGNPNVISDEEKMAVSLAVFFIASGIIVTIITLFIVFLFMFVKRMKKKHIKEAMVHYDFVCPDCSRPLHIYRESEQGYCYNCNTYHDDNITMKK